MAVIMAIVSVDLAYRDYRDFGIAILEDGSSGPNTNFCPRQTVAVEPLHLSASPI